MVPVCTNDGSAKHDPVSSVDTVIWIDVDICAHISVTHIMTSVDFLAAVATATVVTVATGGGTCSEERGKESAQHPSGINETHD